MKPEQLQAIRERAEYATTGPWQRDKCCNVYGPSGEQVINWNSDTVIVADIRFIAHAREDVPALLDYADSLIKENERFRGALEFIQKHRMMVGEIAYIAARNALGNEGKSYAQIYGGQDDPTVAAIKEHRQALAGESAHE